MINFGQLSRRFIPPQQNQPNPNRLRNFNQPIINDEMGNNRYNPGVGFDYGMPQQEPIQQPTQPFQAPMRQGLEGLQDQNPIPPQIPRQQIAPPPTAVSQMPVPQQQPQQEQRPLPIQPFPTSPPQAPPEFDFASKYAEINKRPNRLAYQEAVNKGPEQIKRSKWMRLLAAAGAGAAAAGGTDPAEAARAGTEAYQAPQSRENARYKERIQGLGNLATMEDSDIQDRLKLLEMQRNEMWKGRTDVREDQKMTIEKRDAAIREADLSNRTRFTNAQIDQIKEEINKSQTRTWIDKTKGIMYEMDPAGKITEHKVDSSIAERVKEAGDTAGSEAGAKEKYAAAHDMRLVQGDIDVAALNNAGADDRAASNQQGRIDLAVTRGRLAAKNEPNKDRQAVINYVTDMIARHELPSDALDYVKVNPNNGGLFSEGDNETTKQKVNDAITASFQKSGGGSSNSKGGSGTTKGGVRYDITPSNMSPSNISPNPIKR